jgi:ankyrin repeat protein
VDPDVAELFREVGSGKADAVAEIIKWRPELARARDDSSLSVMQFARYMGREAVLELLVEASRPLDVFEAAMLDRADDLRALLAGDASLSRAHSDDGFTALHMAAYFGATNSVAALLSGGSNIEAVTKNFLQNMPLHAAAAGRRIEAARALLQAGADPNARQHGANTALMTAAFQNSRQLAELLIAFNANVDLRNDEGKTAADVAAGLGNMELAARLRLQERVVDRGHLRRDSGR